MFDNLEIALQVIGTSAGPWWTGGLWFGQTSPTILLECPERLANWTRNSEVWTHAMHALMRDSKAPIYGSLSKCNDPDRPDA